MKQNTDKPRHPDNEVITAMGGPARLAKLLGFDAKTGGTQRVANWAYRGIPPKVKLQRPDIFLKKLSKRRPKNKQIVESCQQKGI